MSMTREEAVGVLEDLEHYHREMQKKWEQSALFTEVKTGMFAREHRIKADAIAMGLSALRPVSREQVEKVWRGEWELIGADKRGRGGLFSCTRCRGLYPVKNQFCPHCGAPMTDEAVDMVMDRLERMKDGEND